MSRRFSDRFLKDSTPMSPETFNPIISAFDAAIDSLERFRVNWQEQVDLFNTNALKRFNDAVKPLVDRMQTAVEGGFLTAQTADLVEIVEGEEVSFFIPVEARVAYRPTPFLAILAPDVRNDWAIGRLLTYNDTTGLLTVEILHLNGSGTERTGWTVAASSGVVEAVYQWMTEVTAMRDQVSAWRDEVAQKWEDVNAAAILIAGGPVSSINGTLFGAVTGVAMEANHYTKAAMDTALAARDTAISEKADAEATTTALGLKADSADVAASLAALEERATELTADFVASGAIGDGKFVVLRSDGKVEQVTGTETALSVGSPAQFASSGTLTMLDARYNAATAKVAVMWRTNTSYWLIVGNVSGSTISFGTALNFGAAGINSGDAKMAWKPDGSKIMVMYGTSGTTSLNCYVVTVSGTTLTPGTLQTLGGPANSLQTNLLVWDGVVDRVVAVINNDYAFAMTVSGTTITFGSPVSFAMSGSASGWNYNDAAARLVIWDLAATQTVRAGTISGTTITLGSAATNPSMIVAGKQVAVSSSGELLVASGLGNSNGPYHVMAVTFSGATATFSSATKLSDITDNAAVRIAYSPYDNKFVVVQSETTTRSDNHEGSRFWVVSISGGAVTVSAQTVAPDAFTSSPTLTFMEDGTAVLLTNLTSKFGAAYQIAGRIIDGVFVLDTKGTPQADLPSTSSAIWVTIPGTGKFINCYTNTNRYAAVETAASFTGNANKWFGVADAAAADGESVQVKLKGAVAGGQTGLTIGASYYLSSDGTLSANDNGRLAGVAVGVTKLRLAA